MANVDLIPVVASKTGTVTPFTACGVTTGDTIKFTNLGKCIVLLKNVGAIDATAKAAATVTAKVDGQTAAPKEAPCPSTVEEKLFTLGPYDPSIYNDTDNKVSIALTFAGVITWSAAVVQIQ